MHQCVVAPNGDCVSESDAAQWLQSHASSPSSSSSSGSSSNNDSSMVYSTAANVSYCSQDDSACMHCRSTWTNEFQEGLALNATTTPHVCFGSNGCVCLAACEAFHTPTLLCPRAALSSSAIATPTPSGGSLQSNKSGATPQGEYAWIFVFVAAFVLASVRSYQSPNSQNGASRHSSLNRVIVQVALTPSLHDLLLAMQTALQRARCIASSSAVTCARSREGRSQHSQAGMHTETSSSSKSSTRLPLAQQLC